MRYDHHHQYCRPSASHARRGRCTEARSRRTSDRSRFDRTSRSGPCRGLRRKHAAQSGRDCFYARSENAVGSEKARIAVRNVRRDGMDHLKADEKKHEISEDERKRLEHEVQKMTDDTIKEVDDAAVAKEKEILGK